MSSIRIENCRECRLARWISASSCWINARRDSVSVKASYMAMCCRRACKRSVSFKSRHFSRALINDFVSWSSVKYALGM